MTLVQYLRRQLERVVRDPLYMLGDRLDGSSSAALMYVAIQPHSVRIRETWEGEKDYQAWRIAILTAAIRAAVVTGEA